MSSQRIDIQQIDPAAYQPMFALEQYIHGGTLGESLLALIKLRASQINGCAYCLDMHAREGREAGVSQRLIDVLAGWRETTDLYSTREQAALKLTESVTLISESGVQQQVWDEVKSVFTEKEIIELLMAISTINVWNRLAIATHQALPNP